MARTPSSASAISPCPACATCIIVTLLLSTISTFNTFGLIYLMTGGGPGGATRLYSILAYEKAIIGLRFGPGRGDRLQHGAGAGDLHLRAGALHAPRSGHQRATSEKITHRSRVWLGRQAV